MEIIATIVIGLIVGVVAKLLMPGRDPGGFIITILLGIAGAFVGTFLGRTLGLYERGEAAGFIVSVLGAILLLAIYRMVVRKRPA
jgi:uncharacterized membrane protein YeaQ/YmgE (transglycosylase-associated protein family)